MKYKRIYIKDIIRIFENSIFKIIGKTEGVYIDNLSDVDSVNETTLDWINSNKENKQSIAKNSKAKVLIVDHSIKPIDDKTLIYVDNPKMFLAMVGNYFFVEKIKPSIHSTAIIDPDAKLGSNISIGPYCVVGKCTIGNNSVLNSNVKIYDDVVIGDNCIIKSGAVLGGEGFGFERDENGNKFRFPQIGQLVIGNNVEIGSNTCIDRGALSDTIIGDYTKINNLCHIAHNNIIGKNVTITGCVNISGSNNIKDNVWIAPNSSIRGWLTIEENATIGMGTVVTKNIPANETWIGNPAHKLEKK